MFLHKVVKDGYILSITKANVGIEITKDEHQQITEAMSHKPVTEGYYYKLRDDNKQWDEFEIPEEDTEQ